MGDSSDSGEFDRAEWALAYQVALRVLRSPDLAADAAQDALLRAYAGRDHYEIHNREAWLRRVSYTCALRYLRSPWHRRRVDATDSDLGDRPAEGPSVHEEVSARLLAVCVEGCLDAMRDADRWLFEERYLRGSTVNEIAEQTGVSPNTAKQRLFRARRRVRQCVEEARCVPADGDAPLAQRRCRPCSGEVPAMDDAEVARYLALLHADWTAIDGARIARIIDCHDFAEALGLARDLGALAEDEGHHPALRVEWGKVTVEIWTRKVEGLTEADFVLAAKIDELLAAGKGEALH